MHAAVFMDRDDTIIANHEVTAGTPHPGDLYDPELVELLPGAGEACKRLQSAGFALVVVTNQGGVARGHCTVEQVDATNDRMRDLLSDAFDVDLAGVYYCPYHPIGRVDAFTREHPWRKPASGMLEAAAVDLDLILHDSWMVGDKTRDVDAGLGAGLAAERCILIGDHPEARCDTLWDAANIILDGAEGSTS